MAVASSLEEQKTLQQLAIQRARATLVEFQKEDALFKQVQGQGDAIDGMLKILKEKYNLHRSKRRTRVEKFDQYTQWLKNFSGIVDILVQVEGWFSEVVPTHKLTSKPKPALPAQSGLRSSSSLRYVSTRHCPGQRRLIQM